MALRWTFRRPANYSILKFKKKRANFILNSVSLEKTILDINGVWNPYIDIVGSWNPYIDIVGKMKTN